MLHRSCVRTASEIVSLPMPRVKSRFDLFFDYCENLEAAFPSVVEMAFQLESERSMRHWVVLTPVLATTDGDYLENYVRQYAQQEFRPTVILFPNASLSKDPDRSLVRACVGKIEELQSKYPSLDLRFVVDPDPSQEFTSIGHLRRKLWDAVVLKTFWEDGENPRTVEMLRVNLLGGVEELARAHHLLGGEYYFFNHDVDLVSLPKNYVREFVNRTVLDEFSDSGRVDWYESKMKHEWVPELPNVSAVVGVYDYLHSSIRSGFEASICVSALTYTEFGGFDPNSFTYEVAGLFRMSPKRRWINNAAAVTSQRRWAERLHSNSIEGVWDKPEESTVASFNEDDECRVGQGLGDITGKRRDALVLEWFSDNDLSFFITLNAFQQLLKDDDGRELALKLVEGEDGELKSVFQEAWGEKIRGSLSRFDRLLTRYEIGCRSQVMSILKPQIEARVQEYLDSILGGTE